MWASPKSTVPIQSSGSPNKHLIPLLQDLLLEKRVLLQETIRLCNEAIDLTDSELQEEYEKEYTRLDILSHKNDKAIADLMKLCDPNQ